MRIVPLDEIRRAVDYAAVIDRMRDALIAQSRGECDTPMPMHLAIAAQRGEVHIKSSYRRDGPYFALKIASTFPANLERDLPTGNGMMLLSSAITGEPVAFLADAGHLTDVRTAAVAALAARELARKDTALGILGTGIQARLQAQMHAQVLDLKRIVLWGRTRERAAQCSRDLRDLFPHIDIEIAASAACRRPPDSPDRHRDGLPRAASLRRRSATRNAHLGGRFGCARQTGARPRHSSPRRPAAGRFPPSM